MEKGNRGRESLKRAKRLPVSILPAILLSLCLALSLSSCGGKNETPRKTVYVAWSNNQESTSFLSVLRAVEAVGADPVVLDMARSADLTYDEDGNLTDTEDAHGILTPEAAKLVKNNTWQNSNVEEIMKNVTGVIFPGGADISPTMYYDEQAWHEIEEDTAYSAERDVSDYLLLSYCLENDIPVLAICRGMQMLSVVSGAEMIQDLSRWYETQGRTYHNMHRDPKKKAFVPHPVTVLSRDSLLYRITGQDSFQGAPSWHHQAVDNVKDTRLIVTATTETDGLPVIEAVERPDKTFCLGVQFHPEIAVRIHLDRKTDTDTFMPYDTAIAFFSAFLDACGPPTE